jgi:2-dehydropantoate 2-reductase
MGCLFAARLAEQGVAVTLVDVDRERLSAIGREGITLTDDGGSRTVAVSAALAGDVAGPVDLVLLFTKGMHSAAAIRSVEHLVETQPVVLTLQNGVGNAELLAEGFGADRVLMGTAHVPADLSGPATVVTHGFGHLDLGGFTPEAHAFAPIVAELLRNAGFGTHVAEDVEATVWEKLAFNAALNAVGMICEVPNAGVDNEPGRRIAAKVVDETVRVAAARGIKLERDRIVATVGAALREHAHHKASMLQDREHGRATEIETINGAVAREGARLGVATPVCDTLTDLVRVIEAARRNKAA